MFNMKKMFEMLGNVHPEYSYYFFHTHSDRKFLFVSEKDIPFKKYDQPVDDDTFPHASKACIERGLLFDIDNNCFVMTKSEDCQSPEKWPMFYIYDGGIPNIIITTQDDAYLFNIIYWDNKHCKYTSIQSITAPTIVSHVSPTCSGDALRKRVFFAKKACKKNKKVLSFNLTESDYITDSEIMLAIDDDLVLGTIEKNVHYSNIIFTQTPFDSMNLSYRALYSREDTDENTSQENDSVKDINTFCVFHTYENDCLILKTYKSEFGENLLVFLNAEIKVNYSLSCFKYEKFVDTEDFKKYVYATDFFKSNPFLIVHCRRNDFENITYAINLKTHAIFNYDVFLKNLTKLICE